MLKSTSPAAARVSALSGCWGGSAWNEDGRASYSCWAATDLPVMRTRNLRSASMSCAEAPSPSRLTSNTPCETWVPTGPHRPGSQRSLSSGPDLPEALLTCTCRMDLPGPTTSVGTRTDYSVGPWDHPACATRHLKAWSTRTTQE
jgi:hypothetical protein